MAAIRKHSNRILAFSLALSMGLFWFSLIDTSHASQVTSRSDTLNNAGTSATSNHAITFTVQNNIASDGSLNGTTAFNTISVTFPSDFNLSTITCNDLDLNINGTATSLNVSNGGTNTTCLNRATSWGALIDSANRIITLTSPTSAASYVWVATGVPITISIGSSATFQGNGTHWITNTTSAGTKSINIGGSFGGTGVIDVAITQSVQISATIAETLTFAINGLPGRRFGGTDVMTGCIAQGPGAPTDDDDLETITAITSTAATVAFGPITPGTAYEACQRLEITTNAGNGYTITSRENHPLMTGGGFVIDDATCLAFGPCTPTSANSFSPPDGDTGLGISCRDSATSVSCSMLNPNWIGGDEWAPISAESKGLSPAKFSGLSSATLALVLAKVKYRLVAPTNTPAGTYTNLVSFIATPVY